MTKLAITFCIASLAFATASQLAVADTYRWIDKEGVVNYSERKPRGVDAELISDSGKPRRRSREPAPAPTYPTASSSNSGSTSTGDNLSEAQQEMLSKLQSAETDRQSQIAKIRSDNCERSRRVLANLSAKERIRVTAQDGTQRVLPEDERQQRIADAQQGIVGNCDA